MSIKSLGVRHGWVVVNKNGRDFPFSLCATRHDSIHDFMNQMPGKDDRPKLPGDYRDDSPWVRYKRAGYRCVAVTWYISE